jgi:hypothetical protein
MRVAVTLLAGYVAAVAVIVGLVVAALASIGQVPVLRHFDSRLPMALAELGTAVALVGLPGWILARGAMALVGLHSAWAFALAGVAAAALGLALLPGMPFSFGMTGAGAVAGIVAGGVERGMTR